jgi:Asp/Glu/hydantoin racemase
MAEFAVEQGRRIGVLATLRTTLDPTTRLLRQVSDAAKTEVELVEGLAGDAYKQLINGNPAGHDEELSKAAKDLVKQGVDTIVLAQGSMARMESQLADETGIRVLASPRMAVEAIREHYA